MSQWLRNRKAVTHLSIKPPSRSYSASKPHGDTRPRDPSSTATPRARRTPSHPGGAHKILSQLRAQHPPGTPAQDPAEGRTEGGTWRAPGPAAPERLRRPRAAPLPAPRPASAGGRRRLMTAGGGRRGAAAAPGGPRSLEAGGGSGPGLGSRPGARGSRRGRGVGSGRGPRCAAITRRVLPPRCCLTVS